MQRILIVLAGALFLDPLATLAANPQSSPDVVYIDGQPCNRACQSYVAWSHNVTRLKGQSERVSTKAAAGSARAKISRKRLAADATNASGATEATIKDARPASNAKDVPDTPNAKGADSRPTVGAATDFTARTARQQVMAATATAEHVTAAAAVAIVIARPEIKSVSDLARRTIAIDANHSALTGDVRTAIAGAGAAEIKLAESQTGAIDRVISGELPAAVLTLVSREAAEGFPGVTGFNVFRIPLTPEMPQAKVADQRPADAVASSSHERTTQELVTAATALAERMTVAVAGSQGAPPTTSNQIDSRIAILIARPEIKSMSALTGKAIAIDDRLLELSRNIEIAMTAAGATGVRVNQPEWKPSEPVIDGAVPAAVLTLVSREAADAFPEIPGFKIFRIPLTPEAPQAKVADLQSAQAFATELNPRATKAAEAKQTAAAVAGEGPRTSSGDRAGDVARLMARASVLLAQGNISAARAVLERAAEAGSARASFTLAETYDPLILPKLGAYGTRGDATKARELYAKAEAGGITEAKARFEALASVAQ